ncbi:IS4 family transposase, partial [Algibacillus agarilyticus]|uniref:IS4 family transposase n=1 Tax=Algibacillus agarilyticus TaxID=2234133 RepID=UPI000DD049C1
MQQLTSQQWANQIFGNANLGDPRRTRRLTQLASDLSNNVGDSIVKSCDSPAHIEAAYRFIRNDAICPDDIAESGYSHTCQLLPDSPLVLAIQDTTELSYEHSVASKLGNVSNSKTKTSRKRSLHVHSTLLLDAQSEKTIGLANQKYWFRENKNKGTREEQQRRKFEDKESSVWMKCFESVKARASNVSNIIDVCDREADIYEYLNYHHTHAHRYLVRAKANRNLLEPRGKLSKLSEDVIGQCCYTVDIAQRGNRPARQAKMTLNYQSITIGKPKRAEGADSLTCNVIICDEKDSDDKEALRWVLYTNETIKNAEDAQRLVRYYELRWRIEEFHKAWKSDGTDVEGLRLQTVDNLKR